MTPTQAQTNVRISRVLYRFHDFEHQRRAFGVLIRNGTPNWQMLANRDYMEWLLRNRDNIKRLRMLAETKTQEKTA